MAQAAEASLEKLLAETPLRIAAGLSSGLSPFHKFGRNEAVGTAEKEIWDGGATNWVAPTAARIHQIASTSADDDGDPGAGVIEWEGLDDDYRLVSGRVVLDGTNDVPTSISLRMIHRMFVVSPAGSTNVGIITATADTDGTVTAQINAGNGQTQMAIFQVPADTNAYMDAVGASLLQALGGNRVVDMTLWANEVDDGGVFLRKFPFGLTNTGTSAFEKEYKKPRLFKPKTILKMTGLADTASSDVAAWFDLTLANRSPFV